MTIARAMATRCSWPPESWRGIVVHPVREPHDLQGREDVLPARRAGESGEQQRQLDVLVGGQDRNEVVRLEDESDVARAERGQLRARESRQVDAGHDDPPVGRRVDAADQVQDRRLAGAGRTHEGEEFARLDLQIEPLEDRDPIESRR